jgi:hypothetical protein
MLARLDRMRGGNPHPRTQLPSLRFDVCHLNE